MRLSKWAFMIVTLFFCGPLQATIINFDEFTLQTPSGWIGPEPVDITGSDYANLTWGSSSENSCNGQVSHWLVTADTMMVSPHSGQNVAMNNYGANNMWFSFSAPVDFTGAWFGQYWAAAWLRPTQIRLRDDLGHVTDWMDIVSNPRFLEANFYGATTIWIERQGQEVPFPMMGDERYFFIDDISYNEINPVPEPTTLLLLGSGIAGLAIFRRKYKDYRG